MIASQNLKNRDFYLNKLIAFQDTEPVKVVTGIRRCGKSSLLKLMVAHLKASGITEEQILELNFESYDFKKMSVDDLYAYVKQRILSNKRMYLFFDEIQRISHWEDAVNSFRVDFDCDIYITGSNAYLLSSEYATYLSGRCVEIKMLPLSFGEFIQFHGFTLKESKSALGGTRKEVIGADGELYALREVFDAYMRFGGMPGIADIGLNQDKALTLLDGIFSTQRFWGEPIPMIYCDKCGWVPMNEEDLPLILPDVAEYEPTDNGESPLAKISEWVNTTCPKRSGAAA